MHAYEIVAMATILNELTQRSIGGSDAYTLHIHQNLDELHAGQPRRPTEHALF